MNFGTKQQKRLSEAQRRAQEIAARVSAPLAEFESTAIAVLDELGAAHQTSNTNPTKARKHLAARLHEIARGLEIATDWTEKRERGDWP